MSLSALRPGARDAWGPDDLIAESPAMRALLQRMEGVLEAPAVLLQGETGSGKDLVARVLHRRAGGGLRPLVKLDAPHLELRRFRAELERLLPTAGSSLVLHEVADLPPEHQSALVEAVASLADVPSSERGRLLCLTQRDLEVEARRGNCPLRLWQRLRPFTLQVPSLRQRPEDLPLLIELFLRSFAFEYERGPVELAAEVWNALLAHGWEGNVRELRNEVERLVVFAPAGSPVGVSGLSAALQPQPSHPAHLSAEGSARSGHGPAAAASPERSTVWGARARRRRYPASALTPVERHLAWIWPSRSGRRQRR